MKKFKFALLAFMTALITFGFTACSDDDDEVKDVPVTGITVSPTTLALKTGTTGTLTATIVPGDASNTTVTWSSSAESVATVDKGVVTAVAEGTATITVKTDDGSFTATCDVTVTSDAPAFDESKYHFDLFLTVGKHGGMSSKNHDCQQHQQTDSRYGNHHRQRGRDRTGRLFYGKHLEG